MNQSFVLFICSEELFDSWQAESWWRENEEKIVDLYSISQISSSQNQYPSDQEVRQRHKNNLYKKKILLIPSLISSTIWYCVIVLVICNASWQEKERKRSKWKRGNFLSIQNKISILAISKKSIYIFFHLRLCCQNQIEAEEAAEISGQRNSWYRCLSSRDDGSVGISETERGGEAAAAEWVVEDEPGVFVILRSLPDGSSVLDRVELK